MKIVAVFYFVNQFSLIHFKSICCWCKIKFFSSRKNERVSFTTLEFNL